jgi:hypothetical protein
MFGSTTKILEINNSIIAEMVEYFKKTNVHLKKIFETQAEIHDMLMKLLEQATTGNDTDSFIGG